MASTKKIAFVTGANTGIGWETVKALIQSQQPYHIYIGSRDVSKGETAIASLKLEVPETSSTLETVQVDVENDESISKAFEKIQAASGHLDVLVNNAGAAVDGKALSGELTMREAWVKDYDINVAGTQVLTHTFVPLLLKSSDPRLLFITSGLSSFDKLTKAFSPHGHVVPAGWPKPTADFVIPDAYRSSKMALNSAMLSWYWQLKEDGVKVWAVSPGFLATGLGGVKERLVQAGAGHPSVGGKLIASVVRGERDGDVGKVVAQNGVQPF